MLVTILQMFPLKKPDTIKSSKHQRTSSDAFQSDDVDIAYNKYYKWAPIIMERTVELESLEHTFIPKVFKEKMWTKLLNPMEMSMPKSLGNSLPMPSWKGIV